MASANPAHAASTSQDSAPPDALASIITQVSATAPPPARRAPPPRKRPAKPAPAKVATPPVPRAQPRPDLPAPVPLPPTTAASTDSTPESSTDEHKGNEKASELLDSPQSSSTLKPASPPPSPFHKPLAATTPPKKRKPSPWQAFLAALGCASRSTQARHFDDHVRTNEKQGEPLPSTPEKLKRRISNQRSQPPAATDTPRAADASSSKASLLPAPAATEAGPSHPAPEQTQHAADRADIHQQEMTANSSRAGVLLPPEETEDVLSAAVVPPGADGHTPTGTPRKRRSRASARGDVTASSAGDSTESGHDDGADDGAGATEDEEDDFLNDQDEEERIIAAGGMGIPIGPDGQPQPLLGDLDERDAGRMCLVLDLDETLVHSSFKLIHPSDYVVPVEIENTSHNVYVIKRPGVDEFLRRMGEIYEVVVFTASLSKYADPVLDQLDVHRVVRHRLFRESCYNHKGNYVKDLSQLGRPMGQTIIIDNSPASYIFHPKNAVPVSSWFNDPHDTELTDMIGVLADLATVDDVRSVLAPFLE